MLNKTGLTLLYDTDKILQQISKTIGDFMETDTTSSIVCVCVNGNDFMQSRWCFEIESNLKSFLLEGFFFFRSNCIREGWIVRCWRGTKTDLCCFILVVWIYDMVTNKRCVILFTVVCHWCCRTRFFISRSWPQEIFFILF